MTLAHPGSSSSIASSSLDVEGPDEVDARQTGPGEVDLEERPQVVHRDHEVRPVDEAGSSADEVPPEDGAEAVASCRDTRGVGHDPLLGRLGARRAWRRRGPRA